MWTVDALALLINKVREKVDSLIVPTKVSDLVNDAGYITSADVPTKTSELVNDSGYVTSAITDVSTGDWTPTISRSGGVTKTSATYIKSGHTVHLAATITVTAGTVSSSAYFDASCLPFTPSSSGAVFGTMSNTSSHAGYALMANPGVNNNVWICGASGGVAGNAISGTFAVHLSYITNS